MNVGDEFIRPDGVKFLVTRTRDTTIFSDTQIRRAIDLVDIQHPNQTDTWVEGFGSVHTGFFLPNDIPNATIKEFLVTDRDYAPKVNHFDRYNIFDKPDLKTRIDLNTTTNYRPVDFAFRGDTLYVTGSDYASSEPGLSNCVGFYIYCYVFRDSVEIYAIPLDYVYALVYPELRSFEAKFPGFKSGKYNVRYGLNGHYKFKASVEKDVECFPTAIRDVTSDKSLNTDKMYDLTGQSLKEKPKHGFYIQGRKKYYQH